jgi:hypothetical protein
MQFVSKYQGNDKFLQIFLDFWLQIDKNCVFLHAN